MQKSAVSHPVMGSLIRRSSLAPPAPIAFAALARTVLTAIDFQLQGVSDLLCRTRTGPLPDALLTWIDANAARHGHGAVTPTGILTGFGDSGTRIETGVKPADWRPARVGRGVAFRGTRASRRPGVRRGPWGTNCILG